MTLPASGTITLGQINTELGRSSSATISLKDAETGIYGAINTNSTYRPSGTAPYAVSDWYCYNHSAFAPLLITTQGSGTWTCPSGCTSILVECWGSGGSGGNASGTNGARGGGGAGGQYANKTISVTPGTVYSYNVASTRSTGGAVTDTWFLNTSTVIAKGGNNGSSTTANIQAASATGSTTGGIGDVVYAGGSGNTGAGGGGAGSTGTGNSATGATAPGAAKTENGGAGGARGALGGAGQAGSVYGGAGGGGTANSATLRLGGTGAQGLLRITNVTVCTPSTTTTTTTVPPTTTTTTTAPGASITVSWFADINCATASYSFRKNGITQASGGGIVSDFGSFTCVVGDVLVAEMTSGSTGTLGCNFAASQIDSNAGTQAQTTNSGINVNATSTWTVTSGTTAVTMYAGLVAQLLL